MSAHLRTPDSPPPASMRSSRNSHLTSPTFAPRRAVMNQYTDGDEPTMSPTRSPNPYNGSDDEELTSPTFAPRRLAGVNSTIFRVEHGNASASIFRAAIRSHNVDATGLFKARTQIRNVSLKEMQTVVLNGTRAEAHEGPEGETRYRYEYKDITYITDELGLVGFLCWKNITTYPQARTEGEKELIHICNSIPNDNCGPSEYIKAAKRLIEEDHVNPNIVSSADGGKTPLMLACQHASVEASITSTADNNHKKNHQTGSEGGNSLLHYLLSVPGIDIDYPSEDRNRSALHHCVNYCSPVAVKLLIDAGADVSVQDSEGKTPLDRISIDERHQYSTDMSERVARIKGLLTLAEADVAARESVLHVGIQNA